MLLGSCLIASNIFLDSSFFLLLWELLDMILEICGKAFPFSEHNFFIGVSIEFYMQFVIDEYGL